MVGATGDATTATAAANRAVTLALPFDDRADFDDARRGRLRSLSPAVVEGTGGRVVWDVEQYGFLDGECPETVNPSLWRQAQLNAIHGLFEVVPGIYQVRGMDLSNMTIVEGDEGILVIDPLISVETAAAALALYRAERGDRPVTGLLYTHSHVDHFGGVRGVLDAHDVGSGRVPVLAPAGFLAQAASENVYAGPAMARRATYMYGALLPKGPTGQVSAGLGLTTSLGQVSLVAPTVDVVRTGQVEVVDGIRMEFQLTPGAEAPAEMNFLLPDHGAFCAAENVTHNLHNVVTLRGALVRDAHAWSRYLNEAIRRFGDRTDVLFAQHHWPRWGRERAIDLLAKQRDLYGYLHDQTLRLMNAGYVGAEIAEMLELPDALALEWHCRGYYGSVSHNVKAIYQRYMGWFDGNPAHLWPHPPVEAARRYVAFMGGADAVVERARRSFEEGDYRWVAEVVHHVVFAEPDHAGARELQADALEQLGFGAENATWRNFYLMGAKELREGIGPTATVTVPPDLVGALSTGQLFDALAVRIDGPGAADRRIVVNWTFTDTGERYTLTLERGVLTYHPDHHSPDAGVTLALARRTLDGVISRTVTLADAVASGAIRVEGDADQLLDLLAFVRPPDPTFPIVTP